MGDIYYSWTDEELKLLTDVYNHKIMFDGYEYIWMVKLNGDWSKHSFQNFETYGKAVHYLRFHMHLWDKEIHKRKHKKKRKDLKTLITHILKDLDYNTLNNTQKLRLLDIALKHSLPKLSIEEHINNSPSEMTIKFVDSNDNLIRKDHHIYD